MKGIVVDIKEKYAVVLNNKGEFIKIKNHSKLTVGYEVDIASKVIDFNIKAFSKIASIAAVLLLVFGISIGVYGYNMPYSYVNVDINPSCEFTVNMFNKVLDAKALNDDGKKLLEKGSYKHLKIEDVIEGVIEEAVKEGYLGESSENAVMITVSGKDDKKVSEIKEELLNTANVTLEHDKVQSEVIAEKAALSRRDEAKKLGISPGKIILIEKLQEVNPEVVVEQYKDVAVKDIVKSIKEMKKERKEPKDKNNDVKIKDNSKITPGKNGKDKEDEKEKNKEKAEKTPKNNDNDEDKEKEMDRIDNRDEKGNEDKEQKRKDNQSFKDIADKEKDIFERNNEDEENRRQKRINNDRD